MGGDEGLSALVLSLLLAAAGGWPVHGHDDAEQRYSPLDGITAENVGSLGLAWSYMTGTKRGLEATPIVVDGVLYTTGSWSVVYALDAATGRELWRYDPEVPRARGRFACCDVVNRGVAVWEGRVYLGALDGRLIALEAATGKPVWQVQTTDPRKPYTITGAPRVVKGMVVIGNGGGEFGVRGYFGAYDARTGERLWRFYTVPASPEQPREHPELELAASTWSPDSVWEAGLGGTVWDSFAFDPELDLLYVGVGNSTPYNREVRSPGGGDNLFLASILAVRPDTGRLVWHYQTTPGESWDYTATQHMILADLEIEGRLRRVLMQAPKNGFFYVLDRATGELISAEPYAHLNWASHVDTKSGRPVESGDAGWADGTAFVTPGPPGAHGWPPMAWSPQTGLVYIPTTDTVHPFVPEPGFRFKPGGNFNTGEDFTELGRLAADIPESLTMCSPGHLTAWDPLRQRRVWRVEHDDVVTGGVLATAGGLVFQGSGTGVFAAYRAADGERLWSVDVGVAVMAPPVTYSVAGEQYVAVMAGLGGSLGLHFARRIDYLNEGRLLAFKLGADAPLPPVRRRPPRSVDAPALAASPAVVERGRDLYTVNCARCHGMALRATGVLPDLRFSTRAVHDAWEEIVLGGLYQERGMASFADVLEPGDVQAIHAFVVERARHEPTVGERVLAWVAGRVCIPPLWMAD